MKIAPMLALVLLLSIPGAASAAPVLLGDGQQAGVTVDGAGTAYIAWIGNEPNTTSLHFCRLPRGAGACDVNIPLSVPGTSLTRPYVLVDGSTVRVLSYRYGLTGGRFDAVYMLTSGNGGATFDGGTQIGTLPFHDAIRGPGGQVSLIANNSSIFQRVPLSPGPVTASANLSPDHPYNPSIALLDPNQILAVFANGSGGAQFRRFPGVGDPNDAANWTPAQDWAPVAGYPRLASGPSGTFVLYDNADGNLEVRKFASDFSGFGPPAVTPPVRAITGGSDDMTQDPAGRLHVVWPQGDANGAHVGYATSDNGTDWQATTFDVTANPNDVQETPNAMRLSVAGDHRGVAVWHNAGGGTPKVHAVDVGPSAGVPPPVVGKTANVVPVSGEVFVKLPAGASPRALGVEAAQAPGFIRLAEAAQVPLGSTLDTTRGRVAVETAAGTAQPGITQTAQFYTGVFQVRQVGGKRRPITEAKLTGTLTCGSRRTGVRSAASRRRLWGNGRGRFRTRGRYATATVRGTKWLMTDTCTTTKTQVKSGTVIVRDLVKRRNVTVKKGKSYTARRR